MIDNRPIGVFDSGAGGLTVVNALKKELPGEEIIYFGDTGRVPYGTRSNDTIIRYTRQDIEFLLGFDIKAVVIACGTASAVALDAVKDAYDIPMMGVVGSASDAAISATKNKKIGVIGTNATIKSDAYRRNIHEKRPDIEVTSAPCSLFVPLVENGRVGKDDRMLQIAIEEYLTPLKEKGIDTLILGCTHYPLIREAIDAFFDGAVTLINPGEAVAKFIKEDGFINKTERKEGQCRFFASDDIDAFKDNMKSFLGFEISSEPGLHIFYEK